LSNPLAVTVDEAALDGIFANLDQGSLPGAAVGVALNGRPVYRKGFGLASMELPIVLSPTLRMRIGSVTKHFTCAAYLLLCRDGDVGIDDPVGRFLPEVSDVTRKVTVRQLMGHVSGLRDAHDIVWQFNGSGHPVSSPDVLSIYRNLADVNAEPGITWIYNNGGFVLLSALIEHICQQSLETVLQQRIFEPTRMSDTLLRRWDTDFVPHSASLHMTQLGGGYQRSYLGTALAGEGGIVSTVDDMLRWLAQMDAPVIGDRAMWETLTQPLELANGTSTGYGLGLRTRTYRGVKTVGHAGGVMGGSSQIFKVPAAGLDVVILVNRHDVSAAALAESVLDACVADLEPIKPRRAVRGSTGLYCSAASGRVVQLSVQENRQMAAIDGVDMEMEPDAAGVMWSVGPFAHLQQGVISKGDSERPASIRLSDFGNVEALESVDTASEPNPGAFLGHYEAMAVKAHAVVCEGAKGPELHTRGPFGSTQYTLTRLGKNIWRACSREVMPWGGILVINEQCDGFRFSTGRLRGLPFRKV